MILNAFSKWAFGFSDIKCPTATCGKIDNTSDAAVDISFKFVETPSGKGTTNIFPNPRAVLTVPTAKGATSICRSQYGGRRGKVAVDQPISDGAGSPICDLWYRSHIFGDNGVLREEMPVIANEFPKNVLMGSICRNKFCSGIHITSFIFENK